MKSRDFWNKIKEALRENWVEILLFVAGVLLLCFFKVPPRMLIC